MGFYVVQKVWIVEAASERDAEHITDPNLYNRMNPKAVFISEIADRNFNVEELKYAGEKSS